MSVLENKKSLRASALEFRKSLSRELKISKDEIVFNKLISSFEYKNAEVVLCYCSTELEIDTIRIINHSLENGKKVAIPLCINKEGKMIFKYISSLNDTKVGMYNILEPISTCKPFVDTEKSICIIPSLMCDFNGFRLGYGKGYYDRFLSEFSGFKCVLCYKESIVDTLPMYDGFDVKCDLIITD